jgi:hypothetical protein
MGTGSFYFDRGTYKIANAQATNSTAMMAQWGNVSFYCTTLFIDVHTTAQTSGECTVQLFDSSGSLEHTIYKIFVHQHSASDPITEHQAIAPMVTFPASYSLRVVSPNTEITLTTGVIGVTYDIIV